METEKWLNRAFPESEHHERLARVRKAMLEAGLDGCICAAPELLYYFTGYEAYTHHAHASQAMILSAEKDDPILVIRDGDIPQADETAWDKDVRSYHIGAEDPCEFIAKAARDKGLIGKTVGIDLGSFSMTGAYFQRLASSLGSTQIVDCTELIGKLRTILSERELAYMREAATYADAGHAAALNHARPGMSEIQLAAEIDYSMRSQGSDYSALPTWIGSGPRSSGLHAMPTKRILEKGDVVHVEFAGVARRYHCVVMRTMVLGEPTKRVREFCDAATGSFLAGLGKVRVNGPTCEVEEAYIHYLEERSMGHYSPMRFGVGISAAYPPSWENKINIIRESDDVFQPGMTFYIHAVLQDFEGQLGAVFGGSFVIIGDGPQQLDSGEFHLAVIDL